jgi:hypothetical protein
MSKTKYRFIAAVAAVAALVAASAASAQATGPGGTPVQGFSVPVLISQLSLYLPEESTRGLGGGGGFGGRGGTGNQGAQGGQANGAAAGQGAQAGSGAAAGQAAGGQRAQGFRQLLQFTRDPKLYLTKDQITKLLPILQGLRESPILTPSKAKQLQASVDALLSVAQKAEYADYQKQMQKAIEEIRKQFAASGASGAAGQGTGAVGGADQGGGQQRQANGAAGGAQLTPTQRAQRELDAFIKVLQDRQKQVGV